MIIASLLPGPLFVVLYAMLVALFAGFVLAGATPIASSRSMRERARTRIRRSSIAPHGDPLYCRHV